MNSSCSLLKSEQAQLCRVCTKRCLRTWVRLSSPGVEKVLDSACKLGPYLAYSLLNLQPLAQYLRYSHYFKMLVSLVFGYGETKTRRQLLLKIWFVTHSCKRSGQAMPYRAAGLVRRQEWGGERWAKALLWFNGKKWVRQGKLVWNWLVWIMSAGSGA